MRYYLLSLKWTHPEDEYFTFLRPVNQGVTFIKCYCGHYEEYTADCIIEMVLDPKPIKLSEILIDSLAVPVMIGEDYRQAIPINDYTLKAIGITRADLKGVSKSDYSDVEPTTGTF